MKWRLDAGQIEVVDDAMAEVYRRATPAQRVEMAFAANRFVRQCIAGHMRELHPDWDNTQIQAEVARKMLGGTR